MSRGVSLRSIAMLRVLLNHYHRDSVEFLIKYLSDEEKQSVLDIGITSGDYSVIADLSKDVIQRFHYSWLYRIVEKVPEELHPFVFASLTKSQAEGLSGLLEEPMQDVSLPDKTKQFFIDYLFPFFSSRNVFPRRWLSESELSPLLEMSKRQLVTTIDFLGIHDLARELPQVLDKKILKGIYEALSETKRLYLRRCLKAKDKASFPDLNLRHWNGDVISLEKTLHYRGLMRLGIAVSQESLNFLWHLCHMLDVGRAQEIKKSVRNKEEIAALSVPLRSHVVDLITFLKEVGHGKKTR